MHSVEVEEIKTGSSLCRLDLACEMHRLRLTYSWQLHVISFSFYSTFFIQFNIYGKDILTGGSNPGI